MTDSTKAQGGSSGGGGVYGLGMIGAAVYYWRQADGSLGSRAKALGKAVVWPAFLVHDVLEHTSRDRHGAPAQEEPAGVSRPEG